MSKLSFGGAMRLPALIGVLFLLTLATPAHAANRRPTISGTPATWVYVGSQYYFQAQGRRSGRSAAALFDPEQTLRGRSFGATTGVLSGTPTAPGFWTNIRITVSDGVNSSQALRFSIRATTRDNVPPVISGTAPTSVIAGSTCTFVPTASDANGDPLRFNIVNRPSLRELRHAHGPTVRHAGRRQRWHVLERDHLRHRRCNDRGARALLDRRVGLGQSRPDDQRDAAGFRDSGRCVQLPARRSRR